MGQTNGTAKALLELLNRPIAFHRIFVKIGGGVTAGLLLAQAHYWTNKLPAEREGWFYKSAAEWEEETGLTRREQETARKHLREKGLLEERIGALKDEGRVLWFRVNQDALIAALTAEAEAAASRPGKASQPAPRAVEGSHDSAKGVAQKRQTPPHDSAIRVAPKRQTSLITSETTAETTSENTPTHGALALAPTPATAVAPSANAGVGVGFSKSRFSLEERKAHAAANGLGGGWLTNSKDGRYDEMIADQLARRTPEAIEQALATPVRTFKPYRAALMHVGSVVTRGGVGSEPGPEIERLFEAGEIDEATRARLLERDWSAGASGQAA
jgi:hypothetical protein